MVYSQCFTCSNPHVADVQTTFLGTPMSSPLSMLSGLPPCSLYALSECSLGALSVLSLCSLSLSLSLSLYLLSLSVLSLCSLCALSVLSVPATLAMVSLKVSIVIGGWKPERLEDCLSWGFLGAPYLGPPSL